MTRDMLPSWNDGATKRAVIDFVTESATEGSPRFVPEAERIAAFDNDGTLWVERPLPVQGPFLLAKIRGLVQADPALAEREPFRSLAEGDQAFLNAVAEEGYDGVMKLVDATGAAWEGTTAREYAAEVGEFLATHHHERYGRPYTELVYKPMLELFDLLRSHDWRLFVCSGGGRDFMRVISEEIWGIPREHIIGSSPEFTYRDGKLVRQRKPHGRLALGPGKVEDLFARTGRVPSFVGGNGNVDKEMLEVADFAAVIVHDDPEREYAYTSGADRVLAAAQKGGWTKVSMKNDWGTLFA